MRSVGVSRLKAEISRYLRVVKRGGEVQVVERGVPIARIVPLPRARRDGGKRARLIRAGILTPGTGDCSAILSRPPLRLPGAALSDALREERRDRV